MRIKVATIQFNVTEGNRAYNLRRAEELMVAAAKDGTELLILPEMWSSGFDFTHLADYSEDGNGETVTFLRKLARELKIYIIGGSFAEKKNGKYYNTCPVIDEKGDIVAKYRKVHLFSHYLNEHLYFQPGEDWGFAEFAKDSEKVKLGLSICYDLRFPEFFRNLALRGARLFTVPAGWPSSRISEFELLCRARAVENRSFLICSNYTDTKKKTYCGNSLIVSPFGEIITKLGNEEGYVLGEIDFSVLNDPNTFNPITDRRQFLDEIDDNQL